jgi:hypothetical protein
VAALVDTNVLVLNDSRKKIVAYRYMLGPKTSTMKAIIFGYSPMSRNVSSAPKIAVIEKDVASSRVNSWASRSYFFALSRSLVKVPITSIRKANIGTARTKAANMRCIWAAIQTRIRGLST